MGGFAHVDGSWCSSFSAKEKLVGPQLQGDTAVLGSCLTFPRGGGGEDKR